MKFQIGNHVTNKITHPRQVGTIVEINKNKKCSYRVDFAGRPAIWHPEKELELFVEKQFQDIDSGLGIGGINNDQSMPAIPSVRAIERVQKMHDTDTICKRCGASANFDGAMFTTLVARISVMIVHRRLP